MGPNHILELFYIRESFPEIFLQLTMIHFISCTGTIIGRRSLTHSCPSRMGAEWRWGCLAGGRGGWMAELVPVP